MRVGEHVVKLLREFMNPLREFIGSLIKIELAYINTNHPHFYGGGSVYAGPAVQAAPVADGDGTPRTSNQALSGLFTSMRDAVSSDTILPYESATFVQLSTKQDFFGDSFGSRPFIRASLFAPRCGLRGSPVPPPPPPDGPAGPERPARAPRSGP